MNNNSTIGYNLSYNNDGDLVGNINVAGGLYNFLCNIYIGDNTDSLCWRLDDNNDPTTTHDNANNNIGIQCNMTHHITMMVI